MEWIESEPDGHEIGPEEVHLWRFPLGTPDASQSALRTLLSAYTGIPAGELTFSRGAHGKPTLSARENQVEFNVSHSGDWGLVAVARVAVGVDVEQVRRRGVSPHLKERFLTPGERELLERKAHEHGDTAFFIVWSRKEAYLKATGLGLAAPFSRVDSSAELLPDLDEAGASAMGGTPWSVREFFVDDRHPAAVVARMRELSPKFLTLWSTLS